jgi:hypothetical protein
MTHIHMPMVVECEDCGRICEAPLMADAQKCCRKSVAKVLLAYAKEQMPCHERRERLEKYIMEILHLDPPIY